MLDKDPERIRNTDFFSLQLGGTVWNLRLSLALYHCCGSGMYGPDPDPNLV
jgi:hypothetical protein